MTETAPPPGYEPIINVGFNKFIGPVLRKSSAAAGEKGRYRIALKPHMLNGGNMAHGGFLMSIADIIMGHAVHEAIAGERAATVSLNCDFVAGARADEVIEGTATITRRTRSLIFVSGELSVVERPVLTATGIWKIIGQ